MKTKNPKTIPEPEIKISPRTGKPLQKQLSKTKGDLKSRARKIVKGLLEGKSEVEAVKTAGYSDSYIHSMKKTILENPVIAKTIREIYESGGISDEYLSTKNLELLNAKETKFFQEKGIVTDERTVEDNSTQLGALRLAHQLKGNLVEQTRETGELTIKVVRYSD